uniref:Uncharacterized protein n=1 Tax=Anopheles culicifacies TaxID=139723 RepID=A0A182M3G8_9DIPT
MIRQRISHVAAIIPFIISTIFSVITRHLFSSSDLIHSGNGSHSVQSWPIGWLATLFGVESSPVVSAIINNLPNTIGINPRVLTTDVTIATRFFLAFLVSGDWIMN